MTVTSVEFGMPFLRQDDRPPCMEHVHLWDLLQGIDVTTPTDDGTASQRHKRAQERRKKALNVAAGRAVCTSCPVQVECLRWGLEHEREPSFLGGMTAQERDEIRTGKLGKVKRPKLPTIAGLSRNQRLASKEQTAADAADLRSGSATLAELAARDHIGRQRVIDRLCTWGFLPTGEAC
jgi:hypothetical protein